MINQFSEDISFELKGFSTSVDWVTTSAKNEGFKCGDLNYIFCSDNYLNTINKKYLNHEDFTDIITFNYNHDDKISGDIFISVERVKENALTEGVDFETELKRVMIHGVLHLCGYNDKTDQEKNTMRAKEDYYLNLHP